MICNRKFKFSIFSNKQYHYHLISWQNYEVYIFILKKNKDNPNLHYWFDLEIAIMPQNIWNKNCNFDPISGYTKPGESNNKVLSGEAED